MNRLQEIWTKRGLPLKSKSKEHKSIILSLQKHLDEIYVTFTGDYIEGDFSQFEVGRDALRIPKETENQPRSVSEENFNCTTQLFGSSSQYSFVD